MGEPAVFKGARGCWGPLLTGPEGQWRDPGWPGVSSGLPEDALGKDPPRWGQGVCVDGCQPYGHPGRGRLVPAWQMSEWESESQ